MGSAPPTAVNAATMPLIPLVVVAPPQPDLIAPKITTVNKFLLMALTPRNGSQWHIKYK